MAKTAIQYDKETGEIITVIKVSIDSDLELNKEGGLEMLEVPNNHECACITEGDFWFVKDEKIEKKTEQQIDKIKTDRVESINQKRMPEFLKTDEEVNAEIILEYINQLKGQGSNITTEDIKAEIEKRKQELYKNPDKKLIKEIKS